MRRNRAASPRKWLRLLLFLALIPATAGAPVDAAEANPAAPLAVLFLIPTRWVVARQFFPIVEMLEEQGVLVEIASDQRHTHTFWEDFVARQTVGDREPSYHLAVDLTYDDVCLADYAAVLVPGGHSHHGIIADERAQEILTAAAATRSVVGGIGQGVSVLVEFGLVRGREATIAPGDEDDAPTPNSRRIIEEAGGVYVASCVVTSTGTESTAIVITSTSRCVTGFARAVLHALFEIEEGAH